MFWCSEAVLLDVRDEVVDLVDEEGGDANDACDAYYDERQASFAEVEVVDWRVWKG